MRSVLFIRHAKSNWDEGVLSDFDRSLSDRGKKEAPEMARRLINRKIPLDSFISSPAKRARKTADFFIDAYGLPKSSLLLKAELYLPSTDAFYDVMEGIDDRFRHPILFSHNPGITHFVNQLTDEIAIDHMPTCSIFAIKTDLTRWQDFRKASKRFWFFDYPKKPL